MEATDRPLGVKVHEKRTVEQIIDEIRHFIGDVETVEETDTGITLGTTLAGVPLTIDVHVTP